MGVSVGLYSPMDVVRLLRGEVNTIITKDKSFGSPLWWAAYALREGDESGLELAKLLLEQGAVVDAIGKEGNDEDDKETVAQKVAKKYVVEADEGADGSTPLLWAARAVSNGVVGGLELAKLLVEKGCNVNIVGRELIDYDDCDYVPHREHDNPRRGTPLVFAALAVSEGAVGGLELAKLLVANHADVNANLMDSYIEGVQGTPLLYAETAVSKGAVGGLELATLLVEKGANVSAPLWYMAVFTEETDGGVELAKRLIKKGANVDIVMEKYSKEGTPLWIAAKEMFDRPGGTELARFLVEIGADVNAVGKADGRESTPLWWMAYAIWWRISIHRSDEASGIIDCLDFAKVLIQSGADVNGVGEGSDFEVGRCTPLWWAALAVSWGDAELGLAKLLVRNGADVNILGPPTDLNSQGGQSSSEEFTLMWSAAKAVKNGKEHGAALVRLLLSAGGKLADTEKAEWQNVVDGVISTLVNRRKSRGCFIGVPGTTGTRAAIVGVAARDDEHLPGVSSDLDLAMSHWGNRSAWTQYGAKTDKHQAMKNITGYLNDDADDDPDADTFVLQWSGHGAGHTGDWCVADGGRITFDDIMGVWDKSRAKARGCLLVLVLDSCHSGKWVELAREHNLQDVTIQAACGSGEVTFDKFFTELIIRYHRGEVTRDEALTVTRSSRRLKMNPCAYVPWGDVSTPLTCKRLDKVFTFLSV
mmetsp:Transcript_10510/g.25756  ORF Transcript_10510/g.25756 Transcript_10510/m.25756 type:complete len:703 (-) Transcript_10510:255-2363(-)